MHDVWEEIRATPELNAPARAAILDRMAPDLLELQPYRLGLSAADLTDYNLCLEMSGASKTLKHIIPESLLYSVFQTKVDQGFVNAPLQLLIILDDAQAYVQQDSSGKMNPLETSAGLIRSSGLGLWVNCQTLRGFSPKLLPNLSGLKLMGPLGCNDDYQRLGSDMGMTREQIEWAKRGTKPGLFIAKSEQSPEPFVVHVPLVRSPRMVSDEEATESVCALDHLPTKRATEYDNWTPNYLIRVKTDQRDTAAPIDSERTAEDPISKTSLDYLHSLAESPFLGASERDASLGLSAWKGNRIRKHLGDRDLIKVVPINPGGQGRRFQLLELTSRGRELLGSFGVTVPGGRGRGGLRHQYWVHTTVMWLTEQGAACRIEDDTRGARVDIAVETSNGTAVVEVETSPGHELQNIQTDLRAGYVQVITLVENTRAVHRIEANLAGAHEVQRSRVHVGCLPEFAEVIGGALGGLFLEPGRGPKQNHNKEKT